MANSRFRGMYVAIPAIGVTILVVVILMVLIRLWMVGAPKYTRKHVRFPNRFKYPNPDDKVQTKPRYYPPASSYTITRPGGETAVYSYPVRAQPSYPTMPGYHNYGFQSKAAPVHPGYSTT